MGSGPSVLELSTSRSRPPRSVDHVDEGGSVVGLGDVAGYGVDGGALERGAEAVCVAGVGHDDPAGVVERAGQRETETRGAAGDEGCGWVR